MDLASPLFSGLIALIALTAFVKIFTTLNIVRYGVGLGDFGFGIVTFVLSLALSFVVTNAQMPGFGGIERLVVAPGGVSAASGNKEPDVERTVTPFLERHTDPKLRFKLNQVASTLKGSAGNASVAGDPGVKDSFSNLVAAFMLSELRGAFELGLVLLIPFLIIDLLVMNGLMLLGVANLPQAVVSLPLKLLLFYAVDGWALIAEKILRGYLP